MLVFLFSYLVAGIIFAVSILLIDVIFFQTNVFEKMTKDHPLLSVMVMTILWPLLFISFIFYVVLNTDFDPAKPLLKFINKVLEKTADRLEKLNEKLKEINKNLDEKSKAKNNSKKS